MKFVQAFPLLLVSTVLLAACGKQPSDEADATPAAPAQEVAAAPAVAAVGKEVNTQEGPYGLSVSPGEVFQCAGRDRTVAKLRWKIDDPAIGNMVEVHVFGPDQAEGKLFAKGGHEGEAETGNWVFEGTRFAVLDPASGKELVSYKVVGLPCQ